MYKIFRKHYEVFFRRAFNSKETTPNGYTEISKFKRNKDFKDGEILHRFPKKELRYFIRSECPTERNENQKGFKHYEIIKAAKRLRYFMNIPENFVCTRCTKRETCKFRDLLPKSKETSVSDLLLVTNGLYDYQNKLYGTKGGNDAQEESEKNENFENQMHHSEKLEDIDEEDEGDDVEEVELEEESDSKDDLKSNEDMEDRYSFKTYESALKVIDSLYPVIEDINHRKGFGCKQFINTHIGENKKLGKLRNELNEGESDEDEGSTYDRRNKRGFNKEYSSRNSRTQVENRENLSWGTKPQNFSTNEREKIRRSDNKFNKKSQARDEFGENDNEISAKSVQNNPRGKPQVHYKEKNMEERDSTLAQRRRNNRYQGNHEEGDDEFTLKESSRNSNRKFVRQQSPKSFDNREKRSEKRFNPREESKRNFKGDSSRRNETQKGSSEHKKSYNENKRPNKEVENRGANLENFMRDIKF